MRQHNLVFYDDSFTYKPYENQRPIPSSLISLNRYISLHDLISKDPDNALKVGSDGLLFIEDCVNE